MSLGLSSPVARFVRSVVSAALSAAFVALLSQSEKVASVVTDLVERIPGLSSDATVVAAVVSVAVVSAVIVAADKAFRDAGVYGDILE